MIPKSVYKRKPKRLPLSLGFSKYRIRFDGSSTRIEIPNDPSLELQEFALTFWLYTKSSWSGPLRLLEWQGSQADTLGFYLNHWDAAPIEFGIYDTGGTKHNMDTKPYRYYPNNLYFVTAQYDGSTLEMYQNDTLTNSISPGVNIGYGGIKSTIGAVKGGGNEWPGFLDGFQLYNRALTASEIRELMLDFHSPLDGLVGWWPFEAGGGTVVYDEEGNVNGDMLNFADPYGWVDVKKWQLRAQKVKGTTT